MSLDVSLILPETKIKRETSGIFVRENGQTKEISRDEWNEKYPNKIPVSFEYEENESNEVFSANITHNLGKMADEAGIYYALWRPEEIGKTKAFEIVDLLEKGLNDLKSRPEYFEQFNSPNGWGLYKHFVPFVEKYLEACKEFPDALIEVSR